MAVLVLNASLRVLFTNPAAERLVAKGDGISVISGLLKLGWEESDEIRIRRALAGDQAAIAALSRAFYVPSMSGRRSYEVTLRIPAVPVYSAEAAAGAAVGLLYVHDPEEGVEVSVDALRRRFGLTASEAKTALAVVCGGGVTQICSLLGLRPMTVRGYLRQVFDKTGAHTQADLVRLVLCGTARLPVAIPPVEGPGARRCR